MKQQKGITLVALVITIIILLILAGISISALTNQGLFTQAQNAKNLTEEKTAEENAILANYLEQIEAITGGIKEEIKLNSVTVSESTTHTATEITFTWDELSTIAKMISNNSEIGNDTLEVKVQTNLGTKTLGVGDTATVDGKKVRILGFNHDTLTSETAYGAKTATGQAGISFEYIEFLAETTMNSTILDGGLGTNENGWGACELRSTLNSTTYNSLSIKNNIKQVQKEFIQTYDDANSKTTCSDYLWLLSCGEIWDNGWNGGVTRGEAIATEGSQYKYYKIENPTYSSETDYIIKQNADNSSFGWWLRSPASGGSDAFCYVFKTGEGATMGAYIDLGVAPGFSI